MSRRIATRFALALAAALGTPPSWASPAQTGAPSPSPSQAPKPALSERPAPEAATPAAQPPQPKPSSREPSAVKPSATKPATTTTATPALKPGQFLWMPELSPQGPVVVVVSLPEQRAHVYRNGVRIGVSTISSGMRGFETRTGVYPILERSSEHYSNLYDNAPMPYMLRLTWSGTALHAGRIPGYPASHGCIRLPKPFAQALFDTVRRGTVAVVADAASHPPAVVSPGWATPVDPATGTPIEIVRAAPARGATAEPATAGPTTAGPTTARPATAGPGPSGPASTEVAAAASAPLATDLWAPERAPDGPLSLLLSTRDRQLMVFRNGIEIGRAEVALTGEPAAGTGLHALHTETTTADTTVADRATEPLWVPSDAIAPPPPIPTLHWRAIAQPGKAGASGAAQPPLRTGTLSPNDAFARQLLPLLSAETPLVITDDALRPLPTAPSAVPAAPAPASPLPTPPQNATPVTPPPPSPAQLPSPPR